MGQKNFTVTLVGRPPMQVAATEIKWNVAARLVMLVTAEDKDETTVGVFPAEHVQGIFVEESTVPTKPRT